MKYIGKLRLLHTECGEVFIFIGYIFIISVYH